MKAAMRHVEEINRMKEALKKTNSEHLRIDYSKSIKRKQKELREYCYYRGFDYKRLIAE